MTTMTIKNITISNMTIPNITINNMTVPIMTVSYLNFPKITLSIITGCRYPVWIASFFSNVIYHSVVVLNQYSACDDLYKSEMDQLCPDAPESTHLWKMTRFGICIFVSAKFPYSYTDVRLID